MRDGAPRRQISEKLLRAALMAGFLALPFALLFRVAPFISDLTIGNDYVTHSIQTQMELQLSLKLGAFPLYAPGYAVGQSAAALTLGQMFHPISHVASHLPGYWRGRALDWSTTLRFLELGAVHFLLFLFLRRVGVAALFAFLFSLPAVYNLRMLDMFRYGASLENYAAYLLLGVLVSWHCLDPGRRWRRAAIAGATYLVICGGHPQMAYYGLLGAGLCAIIAPFWLAAVMPGMDTNVRSVGRYWIEIFLWMSAGGVLSAAYALPFYCDFLTENVARAGREFGWGASSSNTILGSSASLFRPLHSEIHGSFGGPAFLILAAILPVAVLARVRVPRAIWALWLACAAVFLCAQGSQTPVYRLFWTYFPFVSSFRYPGRIAMLLPFPMTLLLAWLAGAAPLQARWHGGYVAVAPYALLAVIAAILPMLYYLFSWETPMDVGVCTPVSINKLSRAFELRALYATLAVLAALAWHGVSARRRRAAGIVLAVAACAQIAMLLNFSTWTTPNIGTLSFDRLLEEKSKSLTYWGVPGTGMEAPSVNRHLEKTFLEPALARIYTRHVSAASQEEAYAILAAERAPGVMVLEESGLEDAGVVPAPGVTSAAAVSSARLELTFNSYNKFLFNAGSRDPGFVLLALPYSRHWRARVNGSPAAILRGDGMYPVVRIPSGKSEVEFRYESQAAVAGMAVSCAALWGIAAYLAFGLRARLRRLLIVGVSAAAVAVFFLAWRHSLYAGRSVGTRFTWTPSSPLAPAFPGRNLAFGKSVTASTPVYAWAPHLFPPNRAVDGETRQTTPYWSQGNGPAWWQVDLGNAAPVAAVAVDAPLGEEAEVLLSTDGRRFGDPIAVGPVDERGVRIAPCGNVAARYVRIEGKDGLRMREVEVYEGK